jgi:carbamoyl-phosphate synthase small subunit
VRYVDDARVEISAHNHNFAVDPDSLPDNVQVTHINLNDGCCEGMRLLDRPAFSVQYHPEAAPGPHDADYIFEKFMKLMEQSDDANS